MTTTANKEVISAANVNAAAATTIVAVATKASIANPILKDMFALPPAERPARKDMIAALIGKAGLTKAGAATYLQNFKSKNGLVAPRAVAATA